MLLHSSSTRMIPQTSLTIFFLLLRALAAVGQTTSSVSLDLHWYVDHLHGTKALIKKRKVSQQNWFRFGKSSSLSKSLIYLTTWDMRTMPRRSSSKHSRNVRFLDAIASTVPVLPLSVGRWLIAIASTELVLCILIVRYENFAEEKLQCNDGSAGGFYYRPSTDIAGENKYHHQHQPRHLHKV